MSNYAEQAAAIADEIVFHFDDMVDTGDHVENADGESFGVPQDTTSTGEAHSLYVIMADGSRYKVTVEHVPDTVPANSFAATVLGVKPTDPYDTPYMQKAAEQGWAVGPAVEGEE
jgi:hypothetical protein